MLKLRNDQSGRLEPFHPLKDSATVYVCGITPYDTTHLGHAFTYLSFDVLIRYLEYLGYQVLYVQNVTDIDDDVLRKGAEVDEDWRALGNRWTRHFIEDMRSLNVRPPDIYPRASETILQMIMDIQLLIDRGFAYSVNGNVYYSVASYARFGQVSGLPEERWLPIANERGNLPDDPNKRHPLDFVLWQAQKPGEPAWGSPWGKGRPGWHIECSTMSSAYLGEVIDIHGGGADLAFPHHECEAAQSYGITGKDVFARFWMHTAMVRYEGEKMSKSLGNLIWARELLQEHSPDAVRILVTLHPYYETWEYDLAELGPADEMAAHLLAAAQVVSRSSSSPLDAAAHVAAFEAAMNDNLDTRAALGALDDLALDILQADEGGQSTAEAGKVLGKLADVFGLRLGGDIETRVREGWTAHHQRFE